METDKISISIKEPISPKISVVNLDSNEPILLSRSPSNTPIHTPKLKPLSSPKVNFGSGAEMLFNTKNLVSEKTNSNSSKDNLEKIDSINLDVNIDEPESKPKGLFGNLFGSSSKVDKSEPNIIQLNDNNNSMFSNKVGSNVLNNASNISNLDKTSGFKEFNNIPVNPDLHVPKKREMSKEELLKEKFKYMRKLEALEKKGIQLTKRYRMEDSLDEMIGEYEMVKSEMQRKKSIKFQGQMLMTFISGIEFLNDKFDPFDLNLNGWAEKINEDVDEYDDIFGQLHEKYAGKAEIAPELKLLFMLGGSGLMVHMTNSMFKSAMPGMDDIMRQNPDMMKQFTQAAVNTMGQENSGFGNFAQNVMGGMNNGPSNQSRQQSMPPRGSPPGPSMEYKKNPPKMNKSTRHNSRPDVGMSRGRPQFDDAVNMDNNFKTVNTRPEMKGPTDLRDILSGLKTKKINIKESSSTVSVDELKEIQGNRGKCKETRRNTKKLKEIKRN